MKLENLNSKEPLIKNFYAWLFDDTSIVDKSVNLQSEIDLTLVHDYLDANIYFPEQIAKLLETKVMKRLGRICQLALSNDLFPNLYHNRLEHSKGVYNRKLEEILYNFQNPNWKKYIEYNNLKIYVLADLIKMLCHDIGHLPLSHAMERQLFSVHGAHEVIGKRIVLEDLEINKILLSISPSLPSILKELYDKDILNFRAHDESSYDVDRFDYLSRDCLYFGTPTYLPYEQYTMSPDLNIDVYEHNSLKNIERFLELRETGYMNIYAAPDTQVREGSIELFFNAFNVSNSSSGEDLRRFIQKFRGRNLKDVDLSEYLEWDDIKFYSEILDIAEHHEDANVRSLAVLTVPEMPAFLNMIYSHLQIHDKGRNYSQNDKEFLKKVQHIIKSDDETSKNLKNPNFVWENTLVYSSDSPLPIRYSSLIKKGVISYSKCRLSAYNANEPIYIKGKDGKIYELSDHPDRKCDWDKKTTFWHVHYAYIPYLKFNGVSDDEINKMKKYFNVGYPSQFQNEAQFNITNPDSVSVNMQPLQVEHSIEDVFLEI